MNGVRKLKEKLKNDKNLKEKLTSSAKIILGNWLAGKKNFWSKYNRMLFILATPLAYIIYLKKYK